MGIGNLGVAGFFSGVRVWGRLRETMPCNLEPLNTSLYSIALVSERSVVKKMENQEHKSLQCEGFQQLAVSSLTLLG